MTEEQFYKITKWQNETFKKRRLSAKQAAEEAFKKLVK